MQIQRIPSFKNPLQKETKEEEKTRRCFHGKEYVSRGNQNPTNFNEKRGGVKEQSQLLEEEKRGKKKEKPKTSLK